MPSITERRSPRQALELPIRVFGVDYQGTHFVEDSTTLVVSRHGAKIRLTRKLIPEMEILILCQDNKHEGLFRVVAQAGEPTGKFFFWGVECLEPAEDIYALGVAMPASEPSPELAPRPVLQMDPNLISKDEFYVQAWLRCSKCGMREPVQLDETQIQAMRKAKGLVRTCPLCGPTTVWRMVSIVGS